MKLFQVQKIIFSIITFFILFVGITNITTAAYFYTLTYTQAGNEITFSLSPGAPLGSAINIYDGSNTNIKILSSSPYVWTAPADGMYSAALRTGSQISNKVTITNGAGSGNAGSAECTNFANCVAPDASGPPQPTGYTPNNFITKLVSDILPVAIGLGGFLSVIIVVVSGLQFITSNGNPEGAAAARGRLIFALVGFVLLILAFAITKVIDSVFLLSGAV